MFVCHSTLCVLTLRVCIRSFNLLLFFKLELFPDYVFRPLECFQMRTLRIDHQINAQFDQMRTNIFRILISSLFNSFLPQTFSFCLSSRELEVRNSLLSCSTPIDRSLLLLQLPLTVTHTAAWPILAERPNERIFYF